MRVMLFTMMLLQHALIARASLLTNFCPTVDAIRLPDEKEQWDADGFQQFFTLELTNWKGNTKRRRQTVYIERNAINPQFCPVVALMFWLRELHVRGIKHGPIFPAINARNGALQPGVRMLSTYYERWATTVFRHMGGKTANCSSHSIRRSSAVWAARCGASETEVQRAGRWNLGSTSFRRYVEDGMSISRRFLGSARRTLDPVYKFFVFRTSVINTSD